ncbi:MAG: hypothetical protein O2782_17585 [bacterium]|nr:hypothetical protein [bacterium]
MDDGTQIPSRFEGDDRQQLPVQPGTQQHFLTDLCVIEIQGGTDAECRHLCDAGSLVVQTARCLRLELVRHVDKDESCNGRNQETNNGKQLELQRLVP